MLLHKALLVALVGLCALPELVRANDTADVIVYGGTGSGIMAAVQASRMGKSVILIEPSKHLGGVTSGGLTATDIGIQKSVGGLTRNFYRSVRKYYEDPENWRHGNFAQYSATFAGKRNITSDAMFSMEPHVAELLFNQLLAAARINVVIGERLDLAKGVSKQENRITQIRMESGRIFAGQAFVDATYEGDLMARAGVTYTVGREAAATYQEQGAGVRVYADRLSSRPIDPYLKPRHPESGLMPNVNLGPIPEAGIADQGVQAYNYRLCLTRVDENKVPFTKPADYDERQYELLFRLYEMGPFNFPLYPVEMPCGKADGNNNGVFSTDYIGMSDAWPEADYAMRDKIAAAHVSYIKGLLWTLANHPRIPKATRAEASAWGFAKDEFVDNGNWPYALYVREARRMVGAFVMTEHEVAGARSVSDPVALGSYFMDSHAVRRYLDAEGYLRIDGGLANIRGFPPYGISYRSLVPKASQCENLWVPICLSASHAAYGSLRMEPVYMMLGEASGIAAALAIDAGLPGQFVPYPALRDHLLASESVLRWPTTISLQEGAKGKKPQPTTRLEGLVVDDGAAVRSGKWLVGAVDSGIGGGYQHDGNREKGTMTARYPFELATGGDYEVRVSYIPHANRAQNVPITIHGNDTETTVHVNQRQAPPIDGQFISLGVFQFAAGDHVSVTISNAGTDGFVVIDAVQLIPRSNPKP